MFRKITNKDLAMNGILAAMYVVLTVGIAPLSYGDIQFRFSEILIFFAFYNRRYIPGLVVGCMVANLWSQIGIIDVFIGGGASWVVCVLIYLVKNKWFVPVIAAIVNGIVVGIELYIFVDLPLFISMVYVAIGEFTVVMIGAFIFNSIEKNSAASQLLKADDPKWQ